METTEGTGRCLLAVTQTIVPNQWCVTRNKHVSVFLRLSKEENEILIVFSGDNDRLLSYALIAKRNNICSDMSPSIKKWEGRQATDRETRQRGRRNESIDNSPSVPIHAIYKGAWWGVGQTSECYSKKSKESHFSWPKKGLLSGASRNVEGMLTYFCVWIF